MFTLCDRLILTQFFFSFNFKFCLLSYIEFSLHMVYTTYLWELQIVFWYLEYLSLFFQLHYWCNKLRNFQFRWEIFLSIFRFFINLKPISWSRGFRLFIGKNNIDHLLPVSFLLRIKYYRFIQSMKKKNIRTKKTKHLDIGNNIKLIHSW